MSRSVVLVQPPESQRQFTRRGTLLPPLGLAMLGSVLRENGHAVRIVDCEGQKLSWDDLAAEMRRSRPDIVGITSTSFTVKQVVKTAQIADENTDALVVVGGPHATVQPLSLLEGSGHVDVTVQNEGEETMLEIVRAFEADSGLEGVDGIGFRKSGKAVLNRPRAPIADLDSLPFPAWDLIPQDAWKNYWDPRCNGHPVVTLQTNRGCPYHCTFCSESTIYGKGVRFKTAARVVDEICHCVDELRVKGISVVDSIFTLRPKLVESVCDEIISRKLDVSWFCNSRVDSLPERLLAKMKKAGCIRIYFGVETGTSKGLVQINKKATLSQARSAVADCKRHGVRTEAGFIIGLPGQTMADICDTVEFAKVLNADSTQFSVLLPLPGTQIYDGLVEAGIDISTMGGGLNSPDVSLCELTCKELRDAQKWAYRSVYLRRQYVLTQLRKVGPKGLADDVFRLVGFVKYMLR